MVIMKDHFTKWVKTRAICDKEVLTVAYAVTHDWILKNENSLHNDRAKDFTAALHQGVCGLLCITKMYSKVYCPETNRMVKCRTPLDTFGDVTSSGI